MVCGGMNGLSQASTAQAMQAAYGSLDYKYIGNQFKPVAEQALGGAVAGLVTGKPWPVVGEYAAATAAATAATTLLSQDFNKWVKAEPQKPSWADFRRMDNK